jgi:glycosyltransferase involved in cell wall biosynthesis
MTNKIKNILIFCSWLDIDTNIGIFFVEQAELIKEEYCPVLVVFRKEYLSRNNIFNNYLVKIKKRKTTSNITVLEVFYPYRKLLTNKVNVFFENLALKKLNSFLKKLKVSTSFVHAQSLFDGGIWAYKYHKLYNTPYLITEHNQISYRNIDSNRTTNSINALKNATKLLVVSNDKIRQFAANGLFFDFINVGNLIQSEFKYIKKNTSSDEFGIVTIGAYTPIKDQSTILEALKIVDNQTKLKINFTWIGFNGWGGNYQKNVIELINQYDYKNIKIKLKSNLDRESVALELHQANLFVFSSISEGMPVSVLEALGCGVPVFSSNCGGVDEIINENNGRIFQIKDAQKLSSLIISYFNKELTFDNEKISKEIIERFGEVAFKNKLLTIYDDIK